MQKMQVVEEVEEIKEVKRALEVEVDGNKEITIILMVVGIVANQATMQVNATITSQQMTGDLVAGSKGTMHLHQIQAMMSAYLLCST